MKSNKPSLMKNRVIFLSDETYGPEVGTGMSEVYECACDDYEPTTKDVTAIGAPAGKKIVTLTVRNVYQEFRPEDHHKFKLKSGYFKDVVFEIKRIVPYTDNPNFLKIVGEGV